MDTLYQKEVESDFSYRVQDYMSESSARQLSLTNAQNNGSLACGIRVCNSDAIQQDGRREHEAVAKRGSAFDNVGAVEYLKI